MYTYAMRMQCICMQKNIREHLLHVTSLRGDVTPSKKDSLVPMTCQQLAVVINPERSLKAELRPVWTRKTKG